MEVKFYAAFGTEECLVVLIPMLGGNNYQVMIDNYYVGSINLMLGGWKAYLNKKEMFTITDCEILIDIIIGEFKPAKLIQ